MPTIYAPPLNNSRPPPGPPFHPSSQVVDHDGVPEDPPPAYTATATTRPGGAEQMISQGPQFMDFSGPPPGTPAGFNRQESSWGARPGVYPGGIPGPSRHIPPTRPVPSTNNGDVAGTSGAPSSVPTPGRALIREGGVLVYPKGHVCQKCRNTGYKNNDPDHPCKNCWKKYSKPYTQALAHSWPTNSNDPIDTTAVSQNLQRPLQHLPASNEHQFGNGSAGPVMNNSMLRPGMIASGGQTNRIPMGYGHPQQQNYHNPPVHPNHWGPHPPMHHQPTSMVVSRDGTGRGQYIPPGALIVRPGDPRLGGMPCLKCYSTGERETFLGLDSETCYYCRGVGRVY